MQQIITVPEHSDELITDQLVIILNQKKAIVNILIVDEFQNRTNKSVTVDITSVLSDFTPTQTDSFKSILKAIIAKSWGITLEEIEGDVI